MHIIGERTHKQALQEGHRAMLAGGRIQEVRQEEQRASEHPSKLEARSRTRKKKLRNLEDESILLLLSISDYS